MRLSFPTCDMRLTACWCAWRRGCGSYVSAFLPISQPHLCLTWLMRSSRCTSCLSPPPRLLCDPVLGQALRLRASPNSATSWNQEVSALGFAFEAAIRQLRWAWGKGEAPEPASPPTPAGVWAFYFFSEVPGDLVPHWPLPPS